VGGEGVLTIEEAITLHNIKIRNFGEDVLVSGYTSKK
jgi:hypothetical protein